MSGKRGKGEERLSPGRILLGGVLGLCLVLLLTLGAAVLISRDTLPMELCQGIGFAALLLGSFFASLFAAWHSCKKLLHGGMAAGMTFLFLLVTGMLLFSGAFESRRLLLSLAGMMIGGLGGVFLAGVFG